jgi:hypothetical protein
MRGLTGALASLTKTVRALPSLAPSLTSPLAAFARLKSGSHTPKGNFSSKRGNKGFYKGKGDKKYGKSTSKGAQRPRSRPRVARTPSNRPHTVRICCRPLGSDQAGRLGDARPVRLYGAAPPAAAALPGVSLLGTPLSYAMQA